MVDWLDIAGIGIGFVGVILMPVVAVQQAHSSMFLGFPIALALMIVMTEAGVYLHSLSERNGKAAI